MKKVKTVKSFRFNGLSHKEMVDIVDNEYPISLKYNKDLVDRIHSRYPIVDKISIAIVVKAVFQSFRELLILGKVLSFHNLFFDTKLLFFTFRRGGITFPALRAKITTPPRMRRI